ncbi:helix-turn-helix domain-containing protein [Maribacter sp. X9]|uniref:helix-turn-helix domain-containing protein n=1 Tax=Maribacter sp. X9 TaxID=3402159 RepID=UPI003AF3DC75
MSLILFIKSKDNTPLKYFAFLLLFFGLIFLDVYLCYTGLIKHILFLNDSTEVFVLMLGPLLYFSTYGFLKRKPIPIKIGWWHFILPAGYFISQIPYYLAPISVKLNAYLGAYHRHLKTAVVPETFDFGYHFVKDIFDWLILISLLTYTLLSLKLVREEHLRALEKKTNGNSAKYIFTRNSAIVLCSFFIAAFIIFYLFDDDGGDQYLSLFQTVVAFSTTYIILRESRFFDKSWVADKYETLGKPVKELTLEEIEDFIEKNDYFTSENASLKDLANELNIHPNQISKAINTGFGFNFNHYINSKRIVLAKKRLTDPKYGQLTIEAIGASVGFKSKSAFYNAFKKHAGSSPSQFLKSIAPKL